MTVEAALILLDVDPKSTRYYGENNLQIKIPEGWYPVGHRTIKENEWWIGPASGKFQMAGYDILTTLALVLAKEDTIDLGIES